MRNGDQIDISDMSTKHIENTINHQQGRLDIVSNLTHRNAIKRAINKFIVELRDRNIDMLLEEIED